MIWFNISVKSFHKNCFRVRSPQAAQTRILNVQLFLATKRNIKGTKITLVVLMGIRGRLGLVWRS